MSTPVASGVGLRWAFSGRPGGVLPSLERMPAWLITAVLGLAYLIAAPPSSDLAAASYRSNLFGRLGLTVWDNGWYGGHHLPAYSLLAPPLGWMLGPRLLAVLSLILAAALFEALVASRFPRPAPRIAAVWFALGAAVALLSCRVAFDLGLAIGLAALLLAQRSRVVPALALGVVCSLSSPVAGGFLALAAGAWALALRRPWPALGLAGGALAPIALLALAFPEGGSQPFVASAFYPALAAILLIAALTLLTRDRRPARGREEERWAAATGMLATGALLYAGALVCAYLVRTPAGGNVDRLGALAAGPIAACALGGRAGARSLLRGASRWRAWVLPVLALPLLYWQANAPAADFAAASGDPSTSASYYAPLLDELGRLGIGYGGRPARIEVVPTADHWEATFLAPRVMLARGWERQLDKRDNALFYSPSPSPDAAALRAWLADKAVSYIALPGASLDYSARGEARLLRAAPPPYLREVWRSRHWRLFAVLGASPLAQAPGVLTQLSSNSFTLAAPTSGSFLVRVRYTPYWTLTQMGLPAAGGCVHEAPGGWTVVQAGAPGRFHVVADFSLARVFEHGPSCTATSTGG